MMLSNYYTEPQVRKLLGGLTVYKVGKLREHVAHIVFGRKYWYLRQDVVDYARKLSETSDFDLAAFNRKRRKLEAEETYELDAGDWPAVQEVLEYFPFSRQRLSQISRPENGEEPEVERTRVNKFWVYDKGRLKEWLLEPGRVQKIAEDRDYEKTEYGDGYNSLEEWKRAVRSW